MMTLAIRLQLNAFNRRYQKHTFQFTMTRFLFTSENVCQNNVYFIVHMHAAIGIVHICDI